MTSTLSLVHSSPVAAVSDRHPPRIGIARPRPAPAALNETHTPAENRAFMAAIREQSRLIRWEARFLARHAADLTRFAEVAQVYDVALWHASNKPARHWAHTGPIRARETVLHDAGPFTFRGAQWIWRLVERAKPSGLWLEVRGDYTPNLPVIVRMPWSVNDAAA